MYNQFFSGNTATQTTGTIPEELMNKQLRDYLLDKGLKKDVSSYPDYIKEHNERQRRKTLNITEPLLELEADKPTVEVSVAEQPVVPKKVFKKHIFNIYPKMSEKDYSALKNDIKTNGYDQKYPIWLYNGDILDGWNRQQACDELNITPVYQNFIGSNSDASSFVIRSNNRRDLTTFQRSCIAIKSASLIEELKAEAKERQIEGGKNKVRQKIAEPKKDANKTDAKLAKLFNTNRTYIQKARKIKSENPEMFERILNGEETINKINIKGIFTHENEWYTPTEYVEKSRRVMGGRIDVDPASSDYAQKVVQAIIYYTIITNGLTKSWYGNIFMNPPFSTAEIVAFINKFIEEYNLGHIKQAIILTNNSTDTDWFHKLMKIAQLACFTDGRVKFYHQEKKPNITHGQVFFYVGNNEDKFIEEFTNVGLIMRRV